MAHFFISPFFFFSFSFYFFTPLLSLGHRWVFILLLCGYIFTNTLLFLIALVQVWDSLLAAFLFASK